ncbi:MAG: TA system VapC family ribonuclease toxin [Verrucomicrobiota bacterium]
MRALLDVNVLIALFDQHHIFHERAHLWLEANAAAGIATCAITENGVVRIISHPKYSRAFLLTPGDVIERLGGFCEAQDHEFWPDDVSLRDTGVFQTDRILGTRQLPDIYLLGLAVSRGGRLVTFDEGITIKAVRNAKAEHLMVI